MNPYLGIESPPALDNPHCQVFFSGQLAPLQKVVCLESYERLKALVRKQYDSPWVSCSTRMPTDKDNVCLWYDKCGPVLAYYDTRPLNPTYWMPIPPLPQPQDAAEKAWEQDRAENKSENSRWSKDDFMRGFNAALKSKEEPKP